MSHLSEILQRNLGQVITPELAAGILAINGAVEPRPIPYNDAPLRARGGLTLRFERAEYCFDEFAQLAQQHWLETESHRADHFRLDKNAYVAADNSGGLLMLIARDDAGKMAGYVIATVGYSKQTSQIEAWEDGLYLAPEYRGKGTAHALVEAIMAKGRAIGVKAVTLSIRDPKVGKLAESHGYDVFGVLYYRRL